MGVLSELDLHPCLRARIHRVHRSPSKTNASSPLQSSPAKGDDGASSTTASTAIPSNGFVLYLPTVCLRHEQNPAFAVACRVANHLQVPLVVLAVVVDDASHACPAHPHRVSPTSQQQQQSSSSSSSSSSVVMTSRRLAFTLQALSHACNLWSGHGAAVGVRIHAGSHPNLKGARTPDHLTLAIRASFVVTDEPFVSPYTTLVSRVEEACRKSNVDCVRVDGSCTVPPLQVLTRRNNAVHGNNNGGIQYDGVPAKAYQWQNKTERLREGHLMAAMEGHYDAPELEIKMNDEDLFATETVSETGKSAATAIEVEEVSIGQRLAPLFPSRWKAQSSKNANDGSDSLCLPSAPDVRPFTSRELFDLYQNDDHRFGPTSTENDATQEESSDDTTNTTNQHNNIKTKTNLPLHKFAMTWPGADRTVPPCPQTIGTTTHGMQRWNNFVQNGGLKKYGKERNDARLVHSPSRMSAYLNLGIVSIFRLVFEVKRAQKQQEANKTKKDGSGDSPKAKRYSKWNNRNKSGADKFEEEIVKWREMSYAHAFSRTDYDGVGSLPRWSVTCLNAHPNRRSYSPEQLANGTTNDAKWNAMQQYLVRTGELHNNVRMTWGKTVVGWNSGLVASMAGESHTTTTTQAEWTLRIMCYLNDRYALDGLSPPSYAGLLWCMGWTDKPSASPGSGDWNIALKPASRYRMTAEDFLMAEEKLLAYGGHQEGCEGGVVDCSSGIAGSSMKRQPSLLDMMKMQSSSNASSAKSPVATRCAASPTSTDTTDSKQSSASKGMKRSGSFTIDRFFSKASRKTAKQESKQIIG